MSNIADIVRKMVRGEIPVQVTVCKVLSVDQGNCTIQAEPVNGHAEMHNVKLRAAADGANTGFVLFPVPGTHVLVASIDNNVNNSFVVMIEQFDRLRISQDNGFSLEVNPQGQVLFNGGNQGGMVIVGNLVARLNSIESDLNTLRTLFNTWIVTPSDGGAALKALITPWASSPLSATQPSQIENTRIKQ